MADRRIWLGVVAALMLGGGAAHAAPQLSVYTWTGYELPQFHAQYDKAHPEGAAITVFGSDDEAFAKLKSGFRPDISHPCADKLPQWREAGLIQPIDPSRIRNWDHLFPVLRALPGVVADGKVWMLPWDWANTSITYRTDLVAGHPDSWGLLWDPRYEQRLAVIDETHDIWLVAAIMAGVDPFHESADDITKVASLLRRQLPLIRLYTTDMTSVEQSLASGEVVAAMTWNATYINLKKQGVPVAFMQPKEKMLTWACGLVILKGTSNLDRVYDFLNAMSSDEAGVALMRTYGYGSANKTAFDSISAADRTGMALPQDPEHALRDTIFLEPMQNRAAIAASYETVKAGG